jgi:hypothetical protein
VGIQAWGIQVFLKGIPGKWMLARRTQVIQTLTQLRKQDRLSGGVVAESGTEFDAKWNKGALKTT